MNQFGDAHTLVSERLSLVKYTESDFDAYYQLARDARIMAMITGTALTVERARERFEKILDHNARYPAFGGFKVYTAQPEVFIGHGRLEVQEHKPDEGEIGYMFFPEYWGQGYGSELTQVLVMHARMQKLRRLQAVIDPENLPSRRILEKNGFTLREKCIMDQLPAEIYHQDL